MSKQIGILTADGGSPDLNAANSGMGKPASTIAPMVANKRKHVPLDHAWIASACAVETCLGDRP